MFCKGKFLRGNFCLARSFHNGILKPRFSSKNGLQCPLSNLKQNEKVINNFSFASQSLRGYNWKSKSTFEVKLYSVIINETTRVIHTSERRYMHPVFWIVLKPVFKIFAVLSGR